jgi:hypothetical protein
MSLPFLYHFLLLLYATHIQTTTPLLRIKHSSCVGTPSICSCSTYDCGGPAFPLQTHQNHYRLQTDDLSKPSSPPSSSSLDRTTYPITHSQFYQGIPEREFWEFRKLRPGQRPQAVRRHALSMSFSLTLFSRAAGWCAGRSPPHSLSSTVRPLCSTSQFRQNVCLTLHRSRLCHSVVQSEMIPHPNCNGSCKHLTSTSDSFARKS